MSANVTLGILMLGYGYGSGTVTFSPKTQSQTVNDPFFGPVTAGTTRNESNVIERFITLGIYLGKSWTLQAAWHALYAQVDEKQFFSNAVLGSSSTPHKGDLGAIMTTAGFGYSF